jgi:hypothetical protein
MPVSRAEWAFMRDQFTAAAPPSTFRSASDRPAEPLKFVCVPVDNFMRVLKNKVRAVSQGAWHFGEAQHASPYGRAHNSRATPGDGPRRSFSTPR